MIEKGKIPVAVVSFDLNSNKPGKRYRYRSPYYDLNTGDVVVVNNKNGLVLARVLDVYWVPPGPAIAESACILTYLNTEQLLKESMQTQALTHADACKELQQDKQRNKQRKEEIENTLRQLRKEIFKLGRELDTL